MKARPLISLPKLDGGNLPEPSDAIDDGKNFLSSAKLEAARMTYVGSLLDEPVSGLSCGFEINFVSPPEALLLVTLHR
jgi:hypothetical protein